MLEGDSAGSPPIQPTAFRWQASEPGAPPVLWVMSCSEGPVPQVSLAALVDFLDVEARPWTLDWEEQFVGLPQRVRHHGARVLGVRAEDLSLVSTTTAGLVTVAQGMRWMAGEEIVTPLGEFPTNAWPWRVLAARGVRVREVPLWPGHQAGAECWESAPPPPDADPEGRLLAALTPATRVLAVSWVRFQDGLRLDLLRLALACSERGVLLVVDGIQGAGTALPPLAGVAAFAVGGHKHLLAPQGLGLLWTHPRLRHQLLPPGGWLSVEEATNFARPSTDFHRPFLKSGEGLEEGVPNLVLAAALGRSLELLAEASVARIEEHIDHLAARFLAALAEVPAWGREARRLEGLRQRGRLGPIVALHHRGEGAEALDARLQAGFDAGIYASIREGYLRVAFHGWHRPSDIDRLVQWLRHEPV
ncbi:MAG: aminotransferase class V-fold PLP-dependent enzyme [Acidobacteriota bacterium]